MTKQKVLLIGNGSSIFNLKRGTEIDAFDGKIVRFNHYQITDYEKYIGTRTDILILGQLDVIEQLEPQYDYILLYQAHLDGGAGLKKIKGLSPHNEIKFFPLYQKDNIRKILLLDKHIEPTTGIIAVHWFNDSDLYLHGFDFSIDEYFANDVDNSEKIKHHDQSKESVHIDYLIKGNHIKRF